MSKAFDRWCKLMAIGARMGCHQMATRSFFYKGYQFPVCARCTGVVLGEVVALILLVCSVRIGFIVAAAFLVPMGIDWSLQYFKVLESDNIRRLLTGALGGFALTYIYYYLILFVLNLF